MVCSIITADECYRATEAVFPGWAMVYDEWGGSECVQPDCYFVVSGEMRWDCNFTSYDTIEPTRVCNIRRAIVADVDESWFFFFVWVVVGAMVVISGSIIYARNWPPRQPHPPQYSVMDSGVKVVVTSDIDADDEMSDASEASATTV
jgi:hypothetical protein